MEADAFDSDGDEAGVSESRGAPVHKLSCDQCRQRKVRCDRVDPCGPCSRKAIPCSYPAGFKPRAKRQRVLVSNGYESKLDDISKKLDRISLAVDGIISSPSHADGNVHVGHRHAAAQKTPASFTSSPFAYTTVNDDASGSDLESDVVLAAQATFATDFAQHTVNNSHSPHGLPEIKSGIDALKKMLKVEHSNNGKSKAAETKVLSPAGSDGFQLPPIQVSIAAIQKLREEPRLKLLWCIELESVGEFMEYFMSVYSGKPSHAELVIVHVGLLNLFWGCAALETDHDLKMELRSHAVVCRGNLDVILANLPFNLPCTFESILGLSMAAGYYINRCRMSLAWTHLSTASQMCITLGLHRDVPLKPESKAFRQRRIKLFWYIHMMDTMLAMRLNRPSSFREKDVTAPFESNVDVAAEGFHVVAPKWVKMSVIQGKIYDDIYSPGALLQPTAVREATARELASKLQDLHLSRDPIEEGFFIMADKILEGSYSQAIRKADTISHLAVLTLIYRSIQPDPNSSSAFCDECLSAAHECLQEHKACLAILRGAGATVLEIYVQWALLAAPFVPFFVLFCHVIETRDRTHLESLAAVVEMLQLLPQDLQDVYDKQARLFKLMYDIACKYIDSAGSGKAPAEPSGRATDVPFEMLFTEAGMNMPSQLPMAPQIYGFQGSQMFGEQLGNMGAGNSGLSGETEMDYGMELGNWFDQNHQIFRMMEDEF